jgi:hypothetical protein
MTRPSWLACWIAGWLPAPRREPSRSTSAWTRDTTTPTPAAWWPDVGTFRTFRTGARNPPYAGIPAGEPTAGSWNEPTAGTICSVGSRFAMRFMQKITLALSSWPALLSVSDAPARHDCFGTHSKYGASAALGAG